MIKKFLSKWIKSSKNPVTEHEQVPVKKHENIAQFRISNENVEIVLDWIKGQEKDYAELLFSINQGAFLKTILNQIKTYCEDTNRLESFNIITEHLHALYLAKKELLESMQDDDAPLIQPENLFTKDIEKDDDLL